MQNPCSSLPAPSFLFASDVDHTLLGDDAALERFAVWFDEARRCVRLAYNSGRFFHSVWQSIEETMLPIPDAIIGGVGTEIHVKSGSGSFLPQPAPRSENVDGKKVPDPFTRLDGWPLPTNGWDPAAIRAILTAHRELELQPEEFQSDHKISCYGYDLNRPFLALLRQQFTDLGRDVEIVYSSDRDLDVLPATANKGSAVAHLAEHWQIEPANVIVAGDSGNDATMFHHNFRGIIVANAKPELLAIDDPNAYRASGQFAAGVLEGLNHWLQRGRESFSGIGSR